MKVEFDKVSDLEMNRAIQRLADAAGKTARDVIVPQSRLFCVDLAYNTRPIGKGASIGAELKRKIAERIDFIYLPIGAAVNMLKEKDEKVAIVFQKALRKRHYSQATALLHRYFPGSWSVGPFDGGDLHKDQRFKRRVTKRRVVTEKGKLTAYKRKEVKQAGFAKGGFAAAARDLGGHRGIPGFATRQPAPGNASVTGTGKSLTVRIVNRVRHIRHALDDVGEARAIRHRVKSITKLLRRMGTRRFKSSTHYLK